MKLLREYDVISSQSGSHIRVIAVVSTEVGDPCIAFVFFFDVPLNIISVLR